jgi:hypothetical protein
MSKRPSTYHRKYRKLRKEVDRWLCSDDPAVAFDLQSDNDERGRSRDDGHCISQEISGVEMQLHSAAEMSEGLSASLESASYFAPECASDCPPVSSSDEEMHQDAEESGTSLQSDLAQWVVDTQLTRESCNKLLCLLRNHGCQMPKDKRTLLKTPRSVNFSEKCGGQYAYFGLEKALHTVACSDLASCSILNLQVNVDGIPLYKSSSTQLWPILCSVNHSQPLIVALYLGKHKPNSVDDFLADFVKEVGDLNTNGFTCLACAGSKTVPFRLHSIVCDAPARAFLKNIKGHNSLSACERCVAVGVSVQHRTVFSSPSCFTAEKRCNTKFNNVEYIGGHQLGPSPLSGVAHNCIDICALDYMHLVCLGVVRRMINFWKNGDRLVKLGSRQLLEISEKLVAMRSFIPSDFARRPRSLLELDRWKATEFRQFVLYTGPVVLKSVLPPLLYKHFLCLSISVSILLTQNDEKRVHHLNYASSLLRHFVAHCEQLYGEAFVVYNVHSLLHLVDDVKYFDTSLDSLSAFPYENFLQTLKRLIRSASNPIVQVAKRLQEYESVNSKPFISSETSKQLKISSKTRDATIYLKNGKFANVDEVKADKLMCRIYKRQSLQPFYFDPCPSDLFDIFFAHERCLDNVSVTSVTMNEIESKGLKLPYGNGFVLMPLLHQNEN